jgi:Flp pilus assembly pilin Flp
MKNNHGQGLVEYVILIALIAIGIALALQLYGVSVYDAYCNVADKVSRGEACKPVQLCGDDFSTNLSGWTLLEGAQGSVQDGKFCPPSYTRMINKCSTSTGLKDYTVALNGANLSSGSGYGVAFRAENTPTGMNGYVFQYDPGYYPGSFIIRKWVNGRELSTPIAIAKATGYDWYNSPRDISVVVKGDTFTAYVDGIAVLTATDSTYTSGGTGLRTWDSTQVCFDQFGMQSAP